MMMKPRGLPGMGGGPGMGPGRPAGGPGGPATLPDGGSLPPGGDTGGSPLLAALAASLSGGGDDPYAEPGTGPTDLNVGTGDPQMGLEDLLQLLAMSMAGVGGGGPPGGAAAGRSGVDPGQYPMGQTPGY